MHASVARLLKCRGARLTHSTALDPLPTVTLTLKLAMRLQFGSDWKSRACTWLGFSASSLYL